MDSPQNKNKPSKWIIRSCALAPWKPSFCVHREITTTNAIYEGERSARVRGGGQNLEPAQLMSPVASCIIARQKKTKKKEGEEAICLYYCSTKEKKKKERGRGSDRSIPCWK
jgi:hypothetical protein